MKYILLTLLLSAGVHAQAQINVKLGHLKTYVGDSVRVCGKVEGGTYLPNANNSPTLINFGMAYPDQLLTVVIFGEHRSLFEGTPETDWVGKTICVTGKVELYRQKPQIVVRSAQQIQIQQ